MSRPRPDSRRAIIRDNEERFARFFVADPTHSASAAAKKCGYHHKWGYDAIRRPRVQEYIRKLSGRSYESLMRTYESKQISESEALEAQRIQVLSAPSEVDVVRVFERLRTFMDFRLVDYLTPDGPLEIDADRIRALQGTDEGRAIKKVRHKNYKTMNKAGEVTSETNTYEIEIESPLEATREMAKVLGLEHVDSEDRRKQTEETFEAALQSLPPEILQKIYLAMMRHGANGNGMLVTGGNGNPS